MNKKLKAVIIGIILLTNSAIANDCVKVRAAFDVGSGSTKLKVAKVDTCMQKIISILHESNGPVPYKQSLKESTNNQLSEKVIDLGVKTIIRLKNEAEAYSPEGYFAVGTSAFRTANNGEKALDEIKIQTGIKVYKISQDREARIGFAGASGLSSKDLKNTIVWDIGGGSMQISSYLGNGKFDIYQGKLASVSFKNYIIETIQGKSKGTKSPNPIGKLEVAESIEYAKEFAKSTIQKSILDKIQKDGIEVIGIGGVHYYSILKSMNEKEGFTLRGLENYIKKHSNKSDIELGGGDYVDTSFSNFILVLGFMKALEIDSIRVGKVNLADGLLLMPELSIE